MDQVYRLFDRRCRMDTASAKLAKLRRRVGRLKPVGKTLPVVCGYTLKDMRTTVSVALV
ncbi:MAG: hypothetical protein HY314_06695 [Acidobacteria bacterium]|nr:hypothetical protein [Acidobacteriota bacterium]